MKAAFFSREQCCKNDRSKQFQSEARTGGDGAGDAGGAGSTVGAKLGV